MEQVSRVCITVISRNKLIQQIFIRTGICAGLFLLVLHPEQTLDSNGNKNKSSEN